MLTVAEADFINVTSSPPPVCGGIVQDGAAAYSSYSCAPAGFRFLFGSDHFSGTASAQSGGIGPIGIGVDTGALASGYASGNGGTAEAFARAFADWDFPVIAFGATGNGFVQFGFTAQIGILNGTTSLSFDGATFIQNVGGSYITGLIPIVFGQTYGLELSARSFSTGLDVVQSRATLSLDSARLFDSNRSLLGGASLVTVDEPSTALLVGIVLMACGLLGARRYRTGMAERYSDQR
jgi:hypothetical protein